MKRVIVPLIIVGLLFSVEFFITRDNTSKCETASTSLCEVELTKGDWQTEYFWYHFERRHDAVDLEIDVTYTLYSGNRRAILMEKDINELPLDLEIGDYISLVNDLKEYSDEYFDEDVNVYFHITSGITHVLYQTELIIAADIYQEHFETWEDQLNYIIDTFGYVNSLQTDLSYIPQHGSSRIVGSNKTIDFSVVEGVLTIVIEQEDSDIVITEAELENYFTRKLESDTYSLTINPNEDN